MGLLEDMLKALDRVEVWKELQNAPKRIAELENRIADLEQKLGGKWPADVCRFCGERAMRLSATLGPNEKGMMREHWDCSACKNQDVRLVKPR
jgi:hypothetical protein